MLTEEKQRRVVKKKKQTQTHSVLKRKFQTEERDKKKYNKKHS